MQLGCQSPNRLQGEAGLWAVAQVGLSPKSGSPLPMSASFCFLRSVSFLPFCNWVTWLLQEADQPPRVRF